jgi:hypothetical protein
MNLGAGVAEFIRFGDQSHRAVAVALP